MIRILSGIRSVAQYLWHRFWALGDGQYASWDVVEILNDNPRVYRVMASGLDFANAWDWSDTLRQMNEERDDFTPVTFVRTEERQAADAILKRSNAFRDWKDGTSHADG